MRDLNAAWHVLGDPARRAAYDRELGRPPQPDGAGEPVDFEIVDFELVDPDLASTASTPTCSTPGRWARPGRCRAGGRCCRRPR